MQSPPVAIWLAVLLSSVVVPAALGQEGTLDPTFGVGGIVGRPGCCEFRRVLAQPDEKLVAVGYITPTGNMLVVRYGANGAPDPAFGTGGVATTAPGRGYAAALQADGKVVAVGRFSGEVMVVRLTDVGGLDGGFGSGGLATSSPCPDSTVVPTAVAVQPSDNKIVVAGSCSAGGFLLRLNADGTPDSGFGIGGVLNVTSHPNGSVRALTGLGLDSLERIVVGGEGESLVPGDRMFLAMRFLAGGTLDGTFGTAGAAFVNVAPNFDEGCLDIAVSASDAVVMAGSYKVSLGAPDHLAVVRLASAGAPDPTFGSAGVVTSTLGGYERAWSTLIQPDGKVVIAGLAGADGNPGTNDFLLARYSPTGVPDASFGMSGLVRTDVSGAGVADEALGLVVQGVGRLVVAGSSVGTPVLVRYSATTPVLLHDMSIE